MSLLPWFQEAQSGNDLGIADCSKCKMNTSAPERQHLGCGYLPPLEDRKRLTMWQPPASEKGYRGIEPTVCAGYSTTLPDVREIAALHAHWSKGNLGAVLGETAHEFVSAALLILDAQCNAMQRWAMTPAAEGGGGK